MPGAVGLAPLAARGVNDQPAIVRAIDKGAAAGNEREVRKAIRRRLRSRAGNRPATIDLRQDRRVGGLLGGVGFDLEYRETNVKTAARVVDDDQIA